MRYLHFLLELKRVPMMIRPNPMISLSATRDCNSNEQKKTPNIFGLSRGHELLKIFPSFSFSVSIALNNFNNFFKKLIKMFVSSTFRRKKMSNKKSNPGVRFSHRPCVAPLRSQRLADIPQFLISCKRKWHKQCKEQQRERWKLTPQQP